MHTLRDATPEARIPREAGRFRKAVTELASIYGEHIRIEDELVFPAAKLGLSSSQKLAIADEMAGRRNNH